MEVGKLTVQKRSLTGKGISRSTRRTGDVPGVCYGSGIETPIPVTVNPKALKASLDPKKRRNTILDLTVEGGETPLSVKAIVWDYQFNAIRQEITHVDLMSVDPNKKLETVVPVKETGTFKGLIDGGILSWERHEVHIMAKPSDIPTELTLNINELGIGDTLHLSDLILPEGVDLVAGSGLTIVTCVAPKALKADKDAVKSDDDDSKPKEESK